MWVPNDYLVKTVFKQRQMDLQQKARIARLLAETRVAKPGLWDRFVSGSGEILIRVGNGLKRTYEPRLDAQIAYRHPVAERPCD